VLNHDTAAHSFLRLILGDLLYENKLLKQHIATLEQKLGLLTERVDEHDQRFDEHDQQIDYAVSRLKQNESVMDAYENRYHDWECSKNYYSLDGDPNCNW
jgi:chromosome segregation ATPase